MARKMDGKWTLALWFGLICTAVPSLCQNPNGTLFLLTSPGVLHAGMPTRLAVTVFSEVVGTVVAEVAHNGTTVAKSEVIYEGSTTVLTLPPIPASLDYGSHLNLTVSGYRGENLIFSNTTSIGFDSRNVRSFIQTDRSRYRPGDTVKVRAVSVQLDNLPYKGRVHLSMLDPSGNSVDSWESTGNLGIVLREFTLSQTPSFGKWTVTVTVNGLTTKDRTFMVEPHEPAHFEVLIKTPQRVLLGDDISGSVRATYSSGEPVQGTLSVFLAEAPDSSTQTKKIYGSAHFSFSKDHLQALQAPARAKDKDVRVVRVSACVTDEATGSKITRSVEVSIQKNAFHLEFYDFPPSLKPSLHFFTKLRISRYDRKPLSSVDQMYSVMVDVTQREPMMDAETTTLTLPVPEDGNIDIKFQLQEQAEGLFIRARFQSFEETLEVYNSHPSPSGSYLQVSSSSSEQILLPSQIDVESTFPLTELHYVVTSRGQVVAAGTTASLSFSVLALSSTPEACLSVYCILSDGEIVSDTTHVPINHPSYVSLEWSNEKAQPGEQVSLSVTVLETGSQVGIMVMGLHDDTLQYDLDLKMKKQCQIRVLTNARLHKDLELSKNEGNSLHLEEYWAPWVKDTEPLLWLDANVSDKTWMSGPIKVPDGVASLGAFALVMSNNLGLGFTAVPQKIHVSKDFSLSLAVPSHLIREEELVVEVEIINHLERDLEVIILLAQSEAFKFILAEQGDAAVINAQKLTLGSHVSAVAMFPIRPVTLGEMEINVDAVSAEASDSLVRKVHVKPEGVEQSFSETLFLELAPLTHNSSKSISFSFPPDVVGGSPRAHVALVGDVLALSLNSLNSLVQLPLGCGEQNMIHFAPSVYVLQYLDRSNQENQELRRRALGYIEEGYQRQLSYQRADGSFSAFGASDMSGSTWLTAFVLRCLLQAQPYIQVEHSVLSGAMSWLLRHQGSQGEFSEVGRLIHTEAQGGQDGHSVTLTAYVMIALLEDEAYAEMFAANVSMGRSYLERRVSGGAVSNYSLCLAAYALALANSPLAGNALEELSRRADYIDGVMMWRASAARNPHDWRPSSAQVEMVAYVMLAHIQRGSLVDGIAFMKWLSKQRNHLGGYGTTQDTVVALQALGYYAAFSGANAINLRLHLSQKGSSQESPFRINSTNFLIYQQQEVDAGKDIHLNIHMEGRGFAIFQLNVFYNLESNAFPRRHQPATDEAAFMLDVDFLDQRDHNHMLLSICMRLKDTQLISQTGMAILDVGMLSGFSLSPGAAAPTHLIRKVETFPEKVSLYLDSLNRTKVCIRLPLVRVYKTAHIKDAVVQVYDYYEPIRRAIVTYNSDTLHKMDYCVFCGVGCSRCRPGISITVFSSHSIRSATYSLSCLLVGVSMFLLLPN